MAFLFLFEWWYKCYILINYSLVLYEVQIILLVFLNLFFSSLLMSPVSHLMIIYATHSFQDCTLPNDLNYHWSYSLCYGDPPKNLNCPCLKLVYEVCFLDKSNPNISFEESYFPVHSLMLLKFRTSSILEYFSMYNLLHPSIVKANFYF